MEQAARCRGRRDAGAQVDPDSAPNRVTRGQPFLESSSSLRERSLGQWPPHPRPSDPTSDSVWSMG